MLRIPSGFEQIKINGEYTLYYVSKDGIVLSLYKNRLLRLKVFMTDKGYKYVKLWINNK